MPKTASSQLTSNTNISKNISRPSSKNINSKDLLSANNNKKGNANILSLNAINN